MKKRLFKLRLAAFLMAVNLLLTFCLPTSVMAVTELTDTSAQIQNDESEHISVSKDAQSDVLGSVADIELDLSAVPDIVGEQKAKSAGHVRRLYSEEENLNSVVFANSDGTRTAYYFDHPVKYLDSDGNVKDISLEIKQHDKLNGAYASADSRTQTIFSAKMADGILLSDTDVSIKLVPVIASIQGGFAPITPVEAGVSIMSTGSDMSVTESTESPVAELVNNKTVSYMLDSKTSYEYTLT